jgi:hypothetical protein
MLLVLWMVFCVLRVLCALSAVCVVCFAIGLVCFVIFYFSGCLPHCEIRIEHNNHCSTVYLVFGLSKQILFLYFDTDL